MVLTRQTQLNKRRGFLWKEIPMELSVDGVYGEACSECRASHLIVLQLTWTKVMGKPGQ